MKMEAKVGGKFKLVVRRQDGSVKKETGWFNNTITNIGLNRMGTGGWFSRIGVGSGSTPPSVDDVWLESQIAVSGVVTGGATPPADSFNTEAPYEATTFIGRRFSDGTAAGNVSEVIVSWGTVSGTAYARQLVLDEEGAPTTITVLSDETLDVYYGLSLYPPYEDADQTGDFEIGEDTHSIVMRTSAVGTADWVPITNEVNAAESTSNRFRVTNGVIGNVFGVPSGTSTSTGLSASMAYSNNSFERQTTVTLDLLQGNLSGGISSARLLTNIGSWQIGFTPAIPKDATKVLTLTFRISWGRYVA